MFCRWGVVFAALVVLGTERAAFAEITLEPISLSYQAPATCPSFEQFLAEIQRSTPRLRMAHAGETARRFEVEIEASGLAGQLALDGGRGGERTVSGADCRAVAELLAFAVALAADPEAQPPESRDVAAFPALGAAPTASVVPTPAEAKAGGGARPKEPGPAPPSAIHGRRLKWGVAGIGFVTGVNSPALTWGGGALAELQWSAVRWAPRFRLAGNYASKTLPEEPGQAVLTTAYLSFEFCSGALHRGAFTFLPCLRVQGGARIAEGVDVGGDRSESRGFLDLGAAGHVRFRFAGPAFIELGAALLFPTVHDRVVILPDKSVYEVPTLGALGECALGVEFGDQTRD